MSSMKQKRIENLRYPHVKRNWIKAIKAIREGYVPIERQNGRKSDKKTKATAQETGGWIAHPDPEHWVQKSSMEAHLIEQSKKRTNYGVWNETGFLKAHRLTA